MNEPEFYTKLFTYYDRTDDACVIFDNKSIIIDVNKSCIDMFGYSKRQLIGSSIFNIVSPENRINARQIFKKVLKGDTYKGDMPLFNRFGKKVNAESYIGPEIIDGIRQYILIAKNITKVIDIQKKFKQLFMVNPAAIVISRISDGKLIDMNEAYEKLIGFKEEYALGKTTIALNLYSKETRDKIVTGFKQKNDGTYSTILDVRNKGGNIRKCIAYFQTTVVKGEKCFMTVLLDQTESVNNQDKLNMALVSQTLYSKVASIANSMLEFEEKIKIIINLIKESINACDILLYDIIDKRYSFETHRNKKHNIDLVKLTERDIKLITQQLVGGSKLLLKEISGLSNLADQVLNPYNSGMVMIVPIYESRKLRAVLSITQCSNQKAWNEETIVLMDTLGTLMSNVYTRNLDEKTLKQRTQENEQSKVALLNVLEDVEGEKTKTEQLARDLEKFKLAVSEASDHIIITDNEGKIIYSNKAVESITGYKIEDVLFKSPGELWGGLMTKEFYEKFWHTIKDEKQTFKGEFSNKKKDGENYIAEASVTPILGDDGEIIFYVGLERDITKLKEIDKMKSEFISIASHQLRTPLSAMKWYLELLIAGDAGKLTSQQLDFAQNINTSNERMIDLVNALLNVSRIESGRIIIDPQPIKIKGLVEGVINEISKRAIDKNIKIIENIQKGMPLVTLDPKLIRNALMNLLTNSIKYSPKKTQISMNVYKEKEYVVFKVSDQGYGIPKADKEKIFTKFYRGKNITKFDTNGNGIGLYLVKQIIDTSGGQIWFESKVNKGTTFWFKLLIKGIPPKKGEVTLEDDF